MQTAGWGRRLDATQPFFCDWKVWEWGVMGETPFSHRFFLKLKMFPRKSCEQILGGGGAESNGIIWISLVDHITFLKIMAAILK